MSSIQEATVSGFNEFISKLKGGQSVVNLKLVQFDDEYETVFDLPLQQVPELTAAMFVARGMTALLDAMGRTITALGEELASMPEADRPGHVIVMTMTDGLENASRGLHPRTDSRHGGASTDSVSLAIHVSRSEPGRNWSGRGSGHIPQLEHELQTESHGGVGYFRRVRVCGG